MDSEEPEEKCQCEECMLEERDTPTDLLSPRDYTQCYEASGDGDSCQSCHDDSAKRRSPKKTAKKRNKNGNLSPNDHSQDCGYSSGNNGGCCETMSGSSSLMSSPEGSEVACSEGFCNHERGDCDTKNEKGPCTGFTLSLQEMLMVNIISFSNEMSLFFLISVLKIFFFFVPGHVFFGRGARHQLYPYRGGFRIQSS